MLHRQSERSRPAPEASTRCPAYDSPAANLAARLHTVQRPPAPATATSAISWRLQALRLFNADRGLEERTGTAYFHLDRKSLLSQAQLSPSVSFCVLCLNPLAHLSRSPVLLPLSICSPPFPPSQDTSLKLPVCNSRPHFAAAAWHCSSAALACMSHPLTLVFAGTVNVWQPKAAAE